MADLDTMERNGLRWTKIGQRLAKYLFLCGGLNKNCNASVVLNASECFKGDFDSQLSRQLCTSHFSLQYFPRLGVYTP